MKESLRPQPRTSPEGDGPDRLLSLQWIAGMFDSFVDSIDVGVYVLDCSGVIKLVNKFVLDQYGWEKDELMGRNIFELMPDLDEAGIEESFRQMIREGRPRQLTNLQREDRLGRPVVYNLKGIPIVEGGEAVGVLAVMNDITEKRVLESQVAEAREYLQSLIDNANDIIYTLDRDGHITFLNKMGQEVTGYEFHGDGEASYTDYIVEKDLEKNEGFFRDTLEGRPQRFATSIVANDGRLVDILINLTPIRKGEEVVGVLGIARDITERKQMQAQLLQASKMAAIGELAAGVAHEINNPVGIISGAAEQLQFLLDRSRERPGDMIDSFLKHIETIREHADRCKRITQGLLNFARKSEIRNAEVDVGKLVSETLALMEDRALSEKKTIETDIPAELPPLTADPHLLGQVFLNFVNNALDAVDEGGRVSIRARAEDGKIAIEVSDDGGGITEENLKKIFDPFFTTKPIGKGTGLGLSICFGIVERMGGTVSVQSKPGAGTTFTVRFPTEPKRAIEK